MRAAGLLAAVTAALPWSSHTAHGATPGLAGLAGITSFGGTSQRLRHTHPGCVLGGASCLLNEVPYNAIHDTREKTLLFKLNLPTSRRHRCDIALQSMRVPVLVVLVALSRAANWPPNG